MTSADGSGMIGWHLLSSGIWAPWLPSWVIFPVDRNGFTVDRHGYAISYEQYERLEIQIRLPILWPSICLYLAILVFILRMVRNCMRAKKSKIVAIEGNVSSGKTTFCVAIQRACPQVRVVFEAINTTLLAVFLKDQKQYALTLQLARMVQRLLELSMVPFFPQEVTLVDRSMMGDLCFALNHYWQNNIDDVGMHIYAAEMRLGQFLKHIKERSLSLIIYLHSSPDQCRQRVSKRGNVDKSTPEDYLNDIDNFHFYGCLYAIHAGLAPVSVLDGLKLVEEDEKARDRRACQTFWSIVDGRRPRARIHFTSSMPSAPAGSDMITIHWNEGLEPLPADRLPRIPAPLRFRHSQAWKNRVMAALASGKQVCFVGDVADSKNPPSTLAGPKSAATVNDSDAAATNPKRAVEESKGTDPFTTRDGGLRQCMYDIFLHLPALVDMPEHIQSLLSPSSQRHTAQETLTSSLTHRATSPVCLLPSAENGLDVSPTAKKSD